MPGGMNMSSVPSPDLCKREMPSLGTLVNNCAVGSDIVLRKFRMLKNRMLEETRRTSANKALCEGDAVEMCSPSMKEVVLDIDSSLEKLNKIADELIYELGLDQEIY